MGKILFPPQKCLVCGILLAEGYSQDELTRSIEEAFGPIDDMSPYRIFDGYSLYYEKEMGRNIQRFFITFQKLFDAQLLADYKLMSNNLENQLFGSPDKITRAVNIDPGYIDLAKLIVASTKDASYRVYLKEGIYAQPMLQFIKGRFVPFEWTYPDYKNDIFIRFFESAREKYKKICRERQT
ncbi:MAG: DUF4416 family protein [Candidatus Aureabacteria bacterium]|nr:DUF4416 family protein [Candidatus Auribacterota bacterium]